MLFLSAMCRYTSRILFVIICFLATGCANIIPPEGGKKDVKAPKLLSSEPADSSLNTRVTKLVLHFDEFIELNNPAAEVQVSPLLPFPVSVINQGKHVTVKIPDSLLQNNTTYRISFGKAIKDLHEGNAFEGYNYMFSTGSYFDSLKLGGKVIDATTGMADADATILLYDAAKNDSAVVREKPLYVGKSSGDGRFTIAGLPAKAFRIYALKDANGNLYFDGAKEKIAFIDSVVHPSDSIAGPVLLRLFAEKEPADTAKKPASERSGLTLGRKGKNADAEALGYSVAVDTSDVKKRSLDITKPLSVTFNRRADSINPKRIFLSYDSSGIAVQTEFAADTDSVKKELFIKTSWKENTVYTLKLLKGFARDTAGVEAMPSKYIFRTRSDADYGRMQINLPAKYNSRMYVLMVQGEKDTVYTKPVTDTIVKLQKLQPGNYRIRIIVDKNQNGVWDTGDLLAKHQPEEVIPYSEPINIKAGWDNITDFDQEKKLRPGASPQKRDKTTGN